MVRSTSHDSSVAHYVVTGMAGAVFGGGLCRTLAQIFFIKTFFSAPGMLFGTIVGALIALFYVWYGKKKGWHLDALVPTFLPLFLPIIDLLTPVPNPWRGPALLLMSVLLSVLVRFQFGRGVGLVLAIFVPLLVYLPDISPYVGRADTFEFQVVAPNLGIAHPSGYPLYVLIGKFFSFLPLGSIAWRINLSSSVLAVCASGVLYLILIESTLIFPDIEEGKTQRLVALLSAFILAFSPTLWSRAVEAEVYTLNACIVALVLWITVQWFTSRLAVNVALPLLGCLSGLAISSHLTLGALAGIIGLSILYKRNEIQLRTLWISVGLGLLGLSLYLLIPLRWPAVTGGEVMSLGHFIRFVTNAESGGALFPRAFIDDPARWRLVFRLIHQQVGWFGLFLAFTGVITLFLNSWPLALGTLLSFGTWVWFNLSFYVSEPDYSAFLVPGYVVLIFWLGFGTLALMRVVMRYVPYAKTASLVVFSLLPLSLLWTKGPVLDTLGLGSADEKWGRYVINLPIEEDAVILADSEKFPPLYYLQQVENLRPDVNIITLFNEEQYRYALMDQLSAGRVVYAARYLPGLDEFGISSLGPLVRVSPESKDDELVLSDIIFGGKLVLNSIDLLSDPEGRPIHHLTLQWFVLEEIAEDLEVRIRLVTKEGNHIIWENEPAHPVNGYSSTTAWVRGSLINDYYALAWPEWLPSSTYRLEIGVFPRFGDQGLQVNDSNEYWTQIADRKFGVQQSDVILQEDPLISMQALYGDDIWLLGVKLSQQVLISSTTSVDAIWLCDEIQKDEMKPKFTWLTADGMTFTPESIYEQSSGMNTIGNLACSGQTEVRRYQVQTPSNPGYYMLMMSIEDGLRNTYTTRCKWLTDHQKACNLAQIHVVPSNEGIVNYDNRLVLKDANWSYEGIPAGGPLSVSIVWRGLQVIDKDYTMFLQIIGPDGQIYGQVDSWPQQGGRPTSGWRVGEEIQDAYTVYLKQDAPPGQYDVILGWYLLADMRRLPVITDSGQIMSDFYKLVTFTITAEGSIK